MTDRAKHDLSIQLNKQQRSVRLADVFQHIAMLATRAQNVASIAIDFWKNFFKVELVLALLADNHVGLRMDAGIVA